MRHRFSSVVILLAASLSISAEAPYIPTDFSGTDPDGLVVHEWGTFTSVAAEDGTAVDWVPQQGPRDLPCFVDRVPVQHQGMAAGHCPDGNAGPLLLLARREGSGRPRAVPARHHHRVVPASRGRAHTDRADDPQKSRARGHDCVESGQGPAARGRGLSGRERRQSLLRSPQDRRVPTRNPN